MAEHFSDFFSKATGQANYPYQEAFATADPVPHLLRAPTSAGKTATAVLGWLFRWVTRADPTPRRLVYCLPMRVLVEQSVMKTKEWITNLGLDIRVHRLMGGVEAEDWHLHPEEPAVLIGTQDMLLSRALNRGYASSRFHWPVDYALLNNDCMWVFDEPQLMGSGVSTSAQLAGLRKSLGVQANCPSVWMSATLEPSWLDTVDFRGQFTGQPLELTSADHDPRLPLYKRMTAAKALHRLRLSAESPKAVADAVMRKHKTGTQTLVIVNTVDRAKELFSELAKLRKKNATPALLLVHSRFRADERNTLNDSLRAQSPGDRIIVATQVVEAGVDISSRTLITELAPWASIVQRIGRCNRTGDDGNADDPAEVFWIDLSEKLTPPYAIHDLIFARIQLEKLEGKSVSPKPLNDFTRNEKITLPFVHKHVLRRRDLLDLFDTTPDLSGNDIDIQRFVRGDDPDTDVQVFWRDLSGTPGEQPRPERNELCNVPVAQVRKFLSAREAGRIEAFLWDHLENQWVRLEPAQLRPGLVLLLPASAGGYTAELGWAPASRERVIPLELQVHQPEESVDSDPNVPAPVALSIRQHTHNVCAALEKLTSALPLGEFAADLMTSAVWHDVGKAHPVCQSAQRTINPSLASDQLWAKTGRQGILRYERKHFRHELASALAAMQHGLPFLCAYLIAAHHGKVRLAIRSLPDEDPPGDPATLFALGIRSGDELPEVALPDGIVCPRTTLDLSPMQLGGERSWSAQALRLLANHGPFKLAYLEAILRIADQRASNEEALHG